MAEDGWNSKTPEKVALAYTPDSLWRNRAEFINGRTAIVQFLAAKWARELDYRLIKELWAFEGNRIAVRFAYEWQNKDGNWFRSYGNENWEFAENGLMQRRIASINDLPIAEADRLMHWPDGPRPGITRVCPNWGCKAPDRKPNSGAAHVAPVPKESGFPHFPRDTLIAVNGTGVPTGTGNRPMTWRRTKDCAVSTRAKETRNENQTRP